MDMAEDDDREEPLILPYRSSPWTLKTSRRSLVLSWSRGGVVGAHAGLAEPCWLHALSQPWVYQSSQWSFQNTPKDSAGISSCWVLLKHGERAIPCSKERLGGGDRRINTTCYTAEMKVCSLFTSRCACILHVTRGQVLERNKYLIFSGWVCLKAE